MGGLLPNRLALYLTAAAALLAALVPVVADLDWESTAGVIAGITALTGVVSVWLRGWSQWERSVVPPGGPLVEPEPPDGFDEDTAEPVPKTVAEAAAAPHGTTLKKP